jgi:hypothetical protein
LHCLRGLLPPRTLQPRARKALGTEVAATPALIAADLVAVDRAGDANPAHTMPFADTAQIDVTLAEIGAQPH